MTIKNSLEKTLQVLLVEDNLADVRLTQEAFNEGKLRKNISVVNDGAEALAFLHREGPYSASPRPDLILLDLNLPKLDGREVLSKIKSDPELQAIPVVILTTSKADSDILKSYELHANCYITKPVDLESFMLIVSSIEQFWLNVVKLPSQKYS